MADERQPVPTKITSRGLRFARYQLTVIQGRDAERSIAGAEDEVSIGTAEGNSLVLTDPAMSRHHVAIVPTARGHMIRDLGSTNGTTVNGVPIVEAFLLPGSVIGLGDTRLRFDVGDSHETAALSADRSFGRALGASAAMRRLFATLTRIATSDATVLLEGETGTGKSLIAASLHEQSARATGPFVVVDCGAIPPNLIESELFGHEKGAFTGATGARVGAFEAAFGGTVFLDEIGELPLDMQPKLLRVLEERVVRRIGRNDDTPLDIRLIAATNRDLRQEANRGRFRADLFYRLDTIRVHVPPLRERPEDIALLVANYYEQLGAGKPPEDVLTDFMRHDWPGNVRELRAAVERFVLLGDITSGDRSAATSDITPPPSEELPFRAAKERAVTQWERDYLSALIAQHKGNISRAARAARMDRNYLRELMTRHGIAIKPEDG